MSRKSHITQRGSKIRIEGEGYEFRAEDVEWLNMHRGVLDRDERGGVTLKFLGEEEALLALDEIVAHGAANSDSLDRPLITSDVTRELAKRLGG